MYVVDPDYVKSKYNLPMLRELENLVADAVQISVPFNNPITGFCAFTHKAGIHAKAILANPSTYEMCVSIRLGTLGFELTWALAQQPQA